jgi:hypothetical protein
MLLIDAANVVGSRPNRWWRDRPGAARDLTARVRRAVVDGTLAPGVVLVIEGEARTGVDEGQLDGVEVVHAAGHGDDAIVALAAQSDTPVVLVSADRGLAARVRESGADVVSPTWLLEQLPP